MATCRVCDRANPDCMSTPFGGCESVPVCGTTCERQWLADHPESVVDGKVRLPSMAERELLAKECGVEVGKISEWFWDQNRSKKRGASKLTITLPASPRGPDGSEPHGRCSACGKCAGLVAHDLLQVRVCRSCFSSLHDLGASAARFWDIGRPPPTVAQSRSDR